MGQSDFQNKRKHMIKNLNFDFKPSAFDTRMKLNGLQN